MLLPVVSAYAQGNGDKATLARRYMQQGEYEKAVPLWEGLYEQAPFDKSVYADYLEALIRSGLFDRADSVVRYMMRIRRGDPVMLVDLGRVYEAAGKHNAAREQYRQAIQAVDGNELSTKSLADAFGHAGHDDYALQTYERAREIMHQPYAYATERSLLYSKSGKNKEAVRALLDMAVIQPNALETVKTALVKIAGSDRNGLALIQKELAARAKEQPDSPVWQELISWIFIQKQDYEGAFRLLTQLDKKLDAGGGNILSFAQNAVKEHQYDIAGKAFDYIRDKGKSSPFYEAASAGSIYLLLDRLEATRPVTTAGVAALLERFPVFFREFPDYKTTDLWRAYARTEALYHNRADTAIALLQEAIGIPNADNAFIGRCKLDLGDYYVLEGKVWDATLLYSQVDKAFRQDMLGETARFKNAKLAYYRGDFALAQDQLTVLKASTTELIANDALDLSIQITENMSPDSNNVPLLRFAAADLLLFQHRYRDSDQLLDSIARMFPSSPLQDDIALLRAKIAREEGRWQDAIAFLQVVLNQYGTDVLGDDAAWQLAGIYQSQLNNLPEAKRYYELLITRYPGSTYVQEARRQYEKLRDVKTPADS